MSEYNKRWGRRKYAKDSPNFCDTNSVLEMASQRKLVAVLVLVYLSFVRASDDDHIELTLGVESGVYIVDCFSFKYFKVQVTEPCEDLRISVIPTKGEPDLYVSRDKVTKPTETSLSWTSYDWGAENLTISSWDPAFEVGTFYIGVHAYCGEDIHGEFQGSEFTVLAESVESAHPASNDLHNSSIVSNLIAQDYQYYRFCVPKLCSSVKVKIENCVDPAECGSYAWPEVLVTRFKEQPTIYDHAWKLASAEYREIELEPSDPDFFSGHYFVGVYGWCTPDDQCPSNDTCGPCHFADGLEYTLSVTVTDVDPCVSYETLDPDPGSCDTSAGAKQKTTCGLSALVSITCILSLLTGYCIYF